MFQYLHSIYYRHTFYNSSISIGSICFFSKPDMHQSNHVLRCDDTGINSSFNFFLSTLLFSDLTWQTKSLTIKVIYIKIITVKDNAIKIYIKNIHFITIKFNITKIFIKIEYIFICIQSSKKLLYHFACNKPIGNKIQCWKKIINSFNTHFWVIYLSG